MVWFRWFSSKRPVFSGFQPLIFRVFFHLERPTWSQSASGWKESWRNVKPTEQQRANRWRMRWSYLRTGWPVGDWRAQKLGDSRDSKVLNNTKKIGFGFFFGRFVGGFLGGVSIFNVLLNDLGLKQRHLLDFEVWMTCVGCKLGPAFLAVVVVSGPIFGAGHTSLSRVRFEVWEQRKLRIFQEDQLVRVILKKYPLARRATKKHNRSACQRHQVVSN